MPKFRDQRLQTDFDRDGYVVCRLLDDNQLAAARQALDASARGRQFERNDFENCYFNSMFEREPGFQGRLRSSMTELFAPRLDAILSDFRVFETSLLFKPENSDELRLHQHVPLTQEPFATNIFSWCPLVDCDEESGTLMLVPGSHHLLRFLRTLETEEFFLDYRDELTRRCAIPVNVKAGEALFFENSLLHGSYPNLGNAHRPVILSILIQPDGIHVVYKSDRNGEVDAIDGRYDEVQCQTMMPGAPDQIPGAIVCHFPAWNAKPTLDEVCELLERGQHAREDFDPLAELRASRGYAQAWRRVGQFFGAGRARA